MQPGRPDFAWRLFCCILAAGIAGCVIGWWAVWLGVPGWWSVLVSMIVGIGIGRASPGRGR